MHFENLSGHMSALGKPSKKKKKSLKNVKLVLIPQNSTKKHRMAESGPIWIENIYFCHFSAKNPKIALSEENQLRIRFNFALQKILAKKGHLRQKLL